MNVREVSVRVLYPTEHNFKAFGRLIKLPSASPSVSASGVLDYWDQVANLELDGGQAELGFLVTKRRPFEFNTMERHVKSDEAFIPLEGKACIFALAPASARSSPQQLPDPSQVTAFILDGSFGANLNAGVWHWAPFPLSDSISFVLALRRGTVEEDIDLRDFTKELGVTFKLAL
ncbi:MAG: ureidoglycolate lyase [Bacillota bacterium]|nr:ureidoglycolate lyase [Bacillota bacterium]